MYNKKGVSAIIINTDLGKEVFDSIKNNRFDINPKVCEGKNIGCEYCKFSDICFVNKKNMVNIDDNLVGGDLSGLY